MELCLYFHMDMILHSYTLKGREALLSMSPTAWQIDYTLTRSV